MELHAYALAAVSHAHFNRFTKLKSDIHPPAPVLSKNNLTQFKFQTRTKRHKYIQNKQPLLTSH